MRCIAMTDPKRLLVLIALADVHLAALRARFEVIYAPDVGTRAAAIQAAGAGGSQFDAVLTNGSTGFGAAEIDALLPTLGLLGALGAGHENLDLAHARERGVTAVNGAGCNEDCVADHALGLLLASVRALPQQDRACRDGVWRDALPLRPTVSFKRLGILGLGSIGAKIARRALGFDMQVGYHNRRPRDGVPYAWFENVLALAGWCDFLVVAVPGGAATRHLIGAAELAALGSDGHLVNIARGSVVDTAALAAALQAGRLGGAGLDVYETEPAPPAALLAFPNVVLSPHVAGWSPEAIRATVDRFIDNAERHFSGRPVLTPI